MLRNINSGLDHKRIPKEVLLTSLYRYDKKDGKYHGKIEKMHRDSA